MEMIIVRDGSVAKAYQADLLAGIAGLGSGTEFAAAARSDVRVLEAAAIGVECVASESGLGAMQKLRQRLESSGHSLVYDSAVEQGGGLFHRLVARGQASALTQLSNIHGVRGALTKRAVSAAAVLALVMAGVAVPATAHAENGVRRGVIDLIGGAAGAAIGNRIGEGKGNQLATVVGGGLGVLFAESVNENMNKRERQRAAVEQQFGRGAQINEDGIWTGGVRQLEPERADAMRGLAGLTARQRASYAVALNQAQQASIDRNIFRGDAQRVEMEGRANARVNAVSRDYSDTRADFMRAYETLGRAGYDVSAYANEYLACQRKVSLADVPTAEARRSYVDPSPARYSAGVSPEF